MSKPITNLQLRCLKVDDKTAIEIGCHNEIEGDNSAYVYLKADTADDLANSLDALAHAVRRWDQQTIVAH